MSQTEELLNAMVHALLQVFHKLAQHLPQLQYEEKIDECQLERCSLEEYQQHTLGDKVEDVLRDNLCLALECSQQSLRFQKKKEIIND